MLTIKDDKALNYNGEEINSPDLSRKEPCITEYDIWSTWANSSFIGSGIGGYFGILY